MIIIRERKMLNEAVRQTIRRVVFRLRVLLLHGAGHMTSPSQTSIPIWKLSHVSCGQVGGNHSACLMFPSWVCGPHQDLPALGVACEDLVGPGRDFSLEVCVLQIGGWLDASWCKLYVDSNFSPGEHSYLSHESYNRGRDTSPRTFRFLNTQFTISWDII